MSLATAIDTIQVIAGIAALLLAGALMLGLRRAGTKAGPIPLLMIVGVLAVAGIELSSAILGSGSVALLVADVVLVSVLAVAVVAVGRVTRKLVHLEQLVAEEQARAAAAADEAAAERERRELAMRDRMGGFDL